MKLFWKWRQRPDNIYRLTSNELVVSGVVKYSLIKGKNATFNILVTPCIPKVDSTRGNPEANEVIVSVKNSMVNESGKPKKDSMVILASDPDQPIAFFQIINDGRHASQKRTKDIPIEEPLSKYDPALQGFRTIEAKFAVDTDGYARVTCSPDEEIHAHVDGSGSLVPLFRATVSVSSNRRQR